jgi:hypothetical protein
MYIFTIVRAAARDGGTAPIARSSRDLSSLHRRQFGSVRRRHSIALDKQALTDQFKTVTNAILEEKPKHSRSKTRST